MNTDEVAAKILVECGYAELQAENAIILVRYGDTPYPESTDLFYSGDDTHRECKSRRQADAIEDWLVNKNQKLWIYSLKDSVLENNTTERGIKLDRIKWCLQQEGLI